MPDYQETAEKGIPAWPYPVNYGKENEVTTDVLVIGGGIDGCHAAINAAKKGLKVAIIEKAATVRSGSGGAGVDHWGAALTDPCSSITPDQIDERRARPGAPPDHDNGISRYITLKESWDYQPGSAYPISKCSETLVSEVSKGGGNVSY